MKYMVGFISYQYPNILREANDALPFCMVLALYHFSFANQLISFCFFCLFSCVNRKGSDLGFEGVGREFIQTDCAINQVDYF